MTLAEFREHCMKLPGFSEDMPFGPDVLAFRVGGKIFALMDVDLFESVPLTPLLLFSKEPKPKQTPAQAAF